jgi:succinyl-CoA synthetase beta subunit
MKVHEYQAKELFREQGIPVPQGRMCTRQDSIREALAWVGGDAWVIKAQVHAGGRGKGGGVRVVHSVEEAEKAAGEILSRKLVTAQTGAEGRQVRKVLIEEAVAIKKELYLGLLLDRSVCLPVVIASAAGGMEIEEVARKEPKKVLREVVDPAVGLRSFQTRRIAAALGLEGDAAKQLGGLLEKLFRLLLDKDASLVEINPLVVTEAGKLIALDAKFQVDDNALFRHPEIASLRDLDEEDPLEVEASEQKLNYIRLDGNIGCMVNGAGLAMATMDLIQLVGGRPANFLDVGGGASAATVEKAFRIILADPRVQAILINIFGGIVRCDRVAQGVIESARKVDLKLPVVIRLEGTNAVEARKMLEASGLKFAVAGTLQEAAEKAVAVMKASV